MTSHRLLLKVAGGERKLQGGEHTYTPHKGHDAAVLKCGPGQRSNRYADTTRSCPKARSGVEHTYTNAQAFPKETTHTQTLALAFLIACDVT